MKIIKIVLYIATCLSLSTLLVACSGGSHPLEGKWVVDEEANDRTVIAGMSMTGMKELEFTDTKAIMGSNVAEVSFEVDGDRVIVSSPQGGMVYELRDNGRIAYKMPMDMEAIFKRKE